MKFHRHLSAAIVGSAILMALAGSVPAAAQSAGFRMDTGLHTFTPGETLRVLVNELGPASRIRVRINIFDAQEQRVMSKAADLKRGTPVTLEFPIVGTATQTLRAQVVFTNAAESVPIMTFESIELDLTVGTRVTCAKPLGRTDPPTSAFCPGVVITNLASV